MLQIADCGATICSWYCVNTCAESIQQYTAVASLKKVIQGIVYKEVALD